MLAVVVNLLAESGAAVAAAMSRSRAPVIPQEPDWLWESIWNAVGDDAAPADSCVLNIPDTVLLSHGIPSHWLATARSGVVIRKKFPKQQHAGNYKKVGVGSRACSPSSARRPAAVV